MKKFNFCSNHFIYIYKIKNIVEMYNYNEKVVWKEVDEIKQETPEVIERQKLFYLECLCRAGHITYEEMWSHMWKSLDEIKEIVKLKKSDKIVWNWEK